MTWVFISKTRTRTDLKAELVEAVDDVEHGGLVTLVEVNALEGLLLGQPVVLGRLVEDLYIFHGNKGGVGVVAKLDLAKAGCYPQLVDEPGDTVTLY